MHKAVAIPRGLVQMPAVTAVHPSSVCMKSGSSTRLPYSTNPWIVISAMPAPKLRYFNNRKRTMGSGVYSSRITKAVSMTVATTARVTMKCEANQSSSWPLSNMICNAAMPTASMPNPHRSTRSFPRRMCGGS